MAQLAPLTRIDGLSGSTAASLADRSLGETQN